jgi:hypothetical protein
VLTTSLVRQKINSKFSVTFFSEKASVLLRECFVIFAMLAGSGTGWSSIASERTAKPTIERRREMKGYWNWSGVGLTVIVVFMSLGTPYLLAQTLGTQPVFNTAVPGQTAAQPEGALKNFVNWIGNVVAPIAAGGAIFGAVVAFMSGRTFGRWLLASAMLLAISGLTRLIEFWILQGVGGVS